MVDLEHIFNKMDNHSTRRMKYFCKKFEYETATINNYGSCPYSDSSRMQKPR